MFAVVTGGSGSGKSVYAETKILQLKENAPEARQFYIATMFPFDDESFKRIERHQAMRAMKHFETIERYTDLKSLEIPNGSIVLLECMSNLTANEMYQDGGAKENTAEEILAGIRHLLGVCKDVVVVTNEVFSDGIAYDPETTRYMEYLGKINAGMASLADEVTEVLYGIPVKHK